ncbi:tRNA preQ1(34) S-adenosylmethionine ribosyltransferase-isomerase QueA [Candidatus Saccharibacteria bacterium]|nr:tRNA preQ1(34) S-adenosylmethionine ribosyltransferase-isomerase QueA [Candidatus Saccharibacteria bacterium]MCB9817116.1 tRNA preQ1(34) S-adenosylmethionine ribosyltransferase-isomerase QueA [Candidatus Nomurabacteria bacterium]
MKISDYNYDLPEDKIALQPVKIRGTSNLLVLHKKSGAIEDKKYSDIVDYLQNGDVLVLNDTKVIKARLNVTKQNGAKRELIILEKHGINDDWHTHKIMYRRKLAVGDVLTVGKATITVNKILGDGLAIVQSSMDLLDVAEQYGSVPLPPYIHRDVKESDTERYQTVWAKEQGSVAAPTASLNMTDDTLANLQSKGIHVVYATLHVGLGTFMPIRTDNVEDHVMHKEYFELPKETIATIQTAKRNNHRVVALGTTITRTLEYCHSQIMQQKPGDVTGEADIFMYPGYKFKIVDALLTNFHAPKSTVLMLAAAFAGWPNLKQAYEHAVESNYKFLSYGDSMLII